MTREMGAPLVSVVVPNYRHEAFLPERLDSILNQTFTDYEVILLDDASPDGSVAVLERYAERFRERLGEGRVRTVFNTENSGSAFAQWNRGVEMARGAYVWIAESDDSADRELLETLIAALKADRSLALAYCDSDLRCRGKSIGLHRDVLHRRFGEWPSEPVSYPGPQFGGACLSVMNVIPNASGVVVRAAALCACVSEGLGFKGSGDWAIWSAVVRHGGVYFHPRAMNYFRQHPVSVTQQNLASPRNLKETLAVIAANRRRFRWPRRSTVLCGCRLFWLAERALAHPDADRWLVVRVVAVAIRFTRRLPPSSLGRCLVRRIVARRSS